jgi:hypothetical protein
VLLFILVTLFIIIIVALLFLVFTIGYLFAKFLEAFLREVSKWNSQYISARDLPYLYSSSPPGHPG